MLSVLETVTVSATMPAWPPDCEDCDWASSDFPSAVPKIRRAQLYQLDVPTSAGLDGIHPAVLEELAAATAFSKGSVKGSVKGSQLGFPRAPVCGQLSSMFP